MRLNRCAHCGVEIDAAVVEYKGRVFCSDDCCEEYEDNLITNGEPDPGELSDEDLEGIDFEDIEFDEEDEDEPDDDIAAADYAEDES